MTALERAADYLTGHLDAADEERFEEELFAGGEVAEEAGFLARLAMLAEHLEARGTLAPGLLRADAEKVLHSGRRVAYLDVGERRDVVWTLPRDCEQFLYRIGVDVAGIERLDVEMEFPGGPSKVFPEVIFDAEDGAVFGLCEASLARMAFDHGPCVVKMSGVAKGAPPRELAVLHVDIRVE